MTKQCPGCGQEIDETAKFCPVCGSKVPFEKPLEHTETEQTTLAAQESAASAQGQEQSSDLKINDADKDPVYTALPRRVRKRKRGALVLAAGAAALVIGLCIKDTSKTANPVPAASDPQIKETQTAANDTFPETIPESALEQSQTTPEPAMEESKAMPKHRYEFVIKNCTWNEAFTEAVLKGGYLVQFDTDEEYSAVKQELMLYDTIKFWIGGRRQDDSREYHWINADKTAGEEVLNSDKYSAYWMQNEPSFRDENLGKDESYMNIFFYKKENRWVWNDVPDDMIDVMPSYAGKVGYIIEYDQ